MADDFDVYHKWLGIPREEQPPHHYRLLGLRPFESDLDVIANAADQRMAHIRTFQSGKHSTQSQQLLNEIAAARVVLLNPAKKHAYDEALRRELSPPAAAATAPPRRAVPLVSAPAAAPVAPAEPLFEIDEPPSSSRRRRRRQNNSTSGAIAGAIALLLVAALGSAAAYYYKHRPADAPRQSAHLPADDDKPDNSEGVKSGEPAPSEQHASAVDPEVAAAAEAKRRTTALVKAVRAKIAAGEVEKTPQAGGGGGGPFEEVSPEGALLVGFRVQFGNWSGHKVIRSVRPIFHDEPEAEPHRNQGAELRAKPGYAVGAIHVRAGYRVDGFEAVFMRITANALDPQDWYSSPWVGGQGGGGAKAIGGDGRAAIGIAGGHGSEVDRLGLVLAGKASVSVDEAVVPIEQAAPVDEPPLTFPERNFAEPAVTKAERRPVPPADVVKAAHDRVRNLFKSEFAAAKIPELKHALAEKLFTKAKETTDDDAGRFAFLEEARTLETQVGNSEALLQAIEVIASQFEVDDIGMTIAALVDAEKVATTPAVKKKLAENCLTLADLAVERERFDVAERVVAIGGGAAKKGNDALQINELTARATKLKEQHAAYDAAQKALATLEQLPDDPAASAQAGRYLCLVRGQWEQGLPRLAKGNHEGLKAVAQQELRKPGSGEDKLALADAWLALAKSGDPQRAACQRRARYWYQEALSGLTGLARSRVQKTLEELSGPHGLKAELFSDPDFKKLVKTRIDPNVDFTWDRGVAPDEDVPPNAFSIRWTGWISAPAKGAYTLVAVHDDHVRVSIDGKKVMGNFRGIGRETFELPMTRKPKAITIEYRNIAAQGHMNLLWSQKDGFALQPVPSAALFHNFAAAQKGFSQDD